LVRMAAYAGLPLGIVTECFGEWKYLLRPGAGAWARGPAAVGVAELGGDTGPPEATGAGGPRAAERFTSGRKGRVKAQFREPSPSGSHPSRCQAQCWTFCLGSAGSSK
jgi:hypothetical protein